MPATDVVIFFVGLTVWSSQVPNDCGVKGILPRVHYTWQNNQNLQVARLGAASSAAKRDVAATTALSVSSSHEHRQPSPAVIAAPLHDTAHVENHAAVLIFPTTSVVSNVGFPAAQGLPKTTTTSLTRTTYTNTTPLFSYIPLDGDRVRFVTSPQNPPIDMSQAVLPQLRDQICPAKMQTLSPDFRPPYRGAAAVFDLPEGTLRSCFSTTKAQKQRLDTRLALTTTGDLIVSASTMKTTKELRLKASPSGRIELLIANVPERFLTGDYAEQSSNALENVSHVNAYYAMGNASGGNCNMTLTDWYNQYSGNTNILQCDMSPFEGAGKTQGSTTTAANKQIDGTVQGANFECSNTQWP